MGRAINCVAIVLLLVSVTGISGDVVIIQPVNRTISVVEKQDVVFACKYPPSESVEWSRSGMRITNTTFDAHRFSIQADERTTDGDVISRLTVNAITRLEGGNYKCSNADFEKALFEDRQTDEVNVVVIKVGLEVHVKGPANNTVTQGEDLTIVCSSDISADLVWQFKGELLTEDSHGHVTLNAEEIIEAGHRRLALTRSRATEDHEGLYTCQDQVSKKQTSILIIVNEIDKIIIVQPANKTITISEGSDIIFECQHPVSESVEWFLSGMRIANTTFDPKRFSIQRDGMATSILTVSSISRAEAGDYKCSNVNIEKAVLREGHTDTVKVKVIQVNAVVSIEGPANKIVSAGNDLLLICTGDITSELIWHFKGNLLTPDLDGQVIITLEENIEIGRKRSALTQSRATADHEGLYSCYDQVNKQQASIAIKVTTSDDGSQVQHSLTLLAITTFATSIVLAIAV